ncbi:MAG: hypothetical protein L0Z55_02490 [Planctomycetes bacterium]|nr:hypothetical protein [Planctomycetota bacterium]
MSPTLELVPRGGSLGVAATEATLRDWLAARSSLLGRNLPGMTAKGFLDYHVAELQGAHRRDDAMTFFDAATPALFICRRLAWDSGLLGFPIASLATFIFPADCAAERAGAALRALCGELRERGQRMCIHKCSAADGATLAALRSAGFDLLTVHLDYLFDAHAARAAPRELEGYEIGEARAAEAEPVAALSRTYYAETDRFHVDPLVPRDRVGAVYEEWARNSFRGYADLIWVARKEGRPVGFGTWGLRGLLAEVTGIRCAQYQLGAVEASERGRGLFRRITAGALARLAERGQRWGTGATNAMNYATQRCFQGLGAANHEPILTFRKDLQLG